ncbi:hypothetical protein TNIN_3201 [Trichonephila inaurata madagascariensis]|uniref:Uncharacterized protein n=1 Tax=Trichonephila inaurata madagascariensis TaxID=2747483 RepID=A0A8X7C5R2_9ARAC|nr:hypothetical protein TNIN_3201 [Trichonephila inaurata madagascariensis]
MHVNSNKASPILSEAPNTDIPPLRRTRSVCRLEVPSFKIPKVSGIVGYLAIVTSSPELCPWGSTAFLPSPPLKSKFRILKRSVAKVTITHKKLRTEVNLSPSVPHRLPSVNLTV